MSKGSRFLKPVEAATAIPGRIECTERSDALDRHAKTCLEYSVVPLQSPINGVVQQLEDLLFGKDVAGGGT
jgi:prephenate dehydratase